MQMRKNRQSSSSSTDWKNSPDENRSRAKNDEVIKAPNIREAPGRKVIEILKKDSKGGHSRDINQWDPMGNS